jgi:hypothetical protein
MKYFLGILIIAFGTLLVIKTEWFVQNFGTNAWAEEHMGTSGGSRLMYKLIGLILILASLMMMTGLLQIMIMGIFGSMFGIK